MKNLGIESKFSAEVLNEKFSGTLWIRDSNIKTKMESLFPDTMKRLIFAGFTNYYSIKNSLFGKFPIHITYYCIETNKESEVALTASEVRDLVERKRFLEPSFILVEPTVKARITSHPPR